MWMQFLPVLAFTVFTGIAALAYPWLWVLTFLGVMELAFSFHFVKENERVVPILLGKIRKEMGATLMAEERAIAANPLATPEQLAMLPNLGLFGTGVVFMLFPLYEMRRYPLTVQTFGVDVGTVSEAPKTQEEGKESAKTQTTQEEGGVVTRRGRHSITTPGHDPHQDFGPAELGLKVVVNFQWNVSNLRPAVANAPPPLDASGDPHPKFLALVRPEIDHAARAAAAGRTWYDVYYDRHGMEHDIEGILAAEDSAFTRSGLSDSTRVKIVLKDVMLPKALRDTINKEQAARFEAEATKRAAEAEKYKREQEGAGLAEARKKLFEAIRGTEEGQTQGNQLAEALLTLREMAQGQASTIFVPEAVTLTLGQAFGEGRPQQVLEMLFAGLTPEQKERLLNEALQRFGRPPGGGRGRQR